jgi:hypothetical protein
MNTRSQMMCLWCGPIAIVIWLVGFGFCAGFLPPLSPSSTAAEITAFYTQHSVLVKLGLILTMFGGSVTGPWVAAITTQMKRIEGRYSPMAYTQLGMGMGGILLFIIPVMNLQTAAFRPERNPDLIQLANDLGWIPFVGVWSMAFVQNIAIGLCILQDTRRVFPRWVGYFNIYTALLFPPGTLIYYFRSGPFAWDGLLSWWLVVTDFVIWFAVMFFVMRKAIREQAAEAPQGEPALTA